MKTLELTKMSQSKLQLPLEGSRDARKMFAFCSEPSRKGTISIKTQLMTCRDAFCAIPEKKFRGLRGFKSLSFRKTRIVVASCGTNDKNMREVVRFLNVLEKHHKWGLTTIRKIDFSKCENISISTKKYLKVYALFASPKWVNSSYTLSLYTLLIRLAITNKSVRDIKTYEDLLNFFKGAYKSIRGDVVYGPRALKAVDFVMSNYNALFKGLTIEDNYVKKLGKAPAYKDLMRAYGEGIAVLLGGVAEHTVVRQRFKKLKEAKKMKRPLVSKVPGHEGPCKPTWINNNSVSRRIDGGVTGFFKNVKKKGPFYFKTGKEFHGIILKDGKIYTTEREDDEEMQRMRKHNGIEGKQEDRT